MNEQELRDEIKRLTQELTTLKEALVPFGRSRRLALPLDVGAKYGGYPRPRGECIWNVNNVNLDQQGIHALSSAIRSSLFGRERKQSKKGYIADCLIPLDSMSVEDYQIYSECMDEMLSVLLKYCQKKGNKNNDEQI